MKSSNKSKKELSKTEKKSFDEYLYYEEEKNFYESMAEAFNSDIEDEAFFHFVMEQNYQNYLRHKESENVLPLMRTITFDNCLTITVNLSLQEDRKKNYIRF